MGMISLLAKSRLRYYKSRTILTMIAIFLTAMLLNSVVTSTMYIINTNRQAIIESGNQHASFFNLSVEQTEILANHLEVEELAILEVAADIEYGKMNGSLVYARTVRGGDVDAAGSLLEGHHPETADEICGPTSFFERLDVEPKIGNQIAISFRPNGLNGLGEIQTKTFTICGLTPSVDISELEISDSRIAYSAEISEAFVEEIIPEEERAYRATFRVHGEENSSFDEMVARLNALAEEIGVPERYVSLNRSYLYAVLDPPMDVIGVACAIAVLVVCFAMLIIYSIYYVNVISDIQEIGKLKALGAGDRQIRRLFRWEGMFCSLIAVPTGLFAGYIVPYVALPYIMDGVRNSAVMLSVDIERPDMLSLPLTFVVAVVVFTAVFVSQLRPIRIATKVSPITAIRYQESSTAQKMRKGFKRIGVGRLGLANLYRNKKRTAVTMLALGLSWVLFMGMAGVLSSISPMDMANRSLAGAQFRIDMDYALEDIVYPENTLNHVQMQNILNAELIGQIEAIDGVKAIRTQAKSLVRIADAPGDNYFYAGQTHDLATLGAIDENRAKQLKEGVQKGKIDYEEMTKENGVIFGMDYYMGEVGLTIGDRVSMTLYDGDREIPFTGKIVASLGYDDGGDFLITEETYARLGIETDTTASLFVDMAEPNFGSAYEKRYEAAKKALSEIVEGEERLSLVSLDKELEYGRWAVALTRYPAYALLILIAIISLMSLINTMIISITTRKRELGMLQAVGLSDKQLVRMLSGEGLFFTAGTLVLAFTVGNVLGYRIFLWAKDNEFMSVSAYRYPLLETLLLCIVLIVGQLLIVFFVRKRIGKESLIDRIRSGE
ncbi:MAG: ABC transporter permease [Lachnospiraceae bacterium]|nr:ABC transporter permease [Lachnospiraceae bacterium]